MFSSHNYTHNNSPSQLHHFKKLSKPTKELIDLHKLRILKILVTHLNKEVWLLSVVLENQWKITSLWDNNKK